MSDQADPNISSYDSEGYEEGDEALYVRHALSVDKGQSPLRIDKYLQSRIEKVTRSKIQSAIKAGAVHVNDIAIKSNYKIRPSDRIIVYLSTPQEEYEILPENIPLNIIYEDELVMVINKEPGLVVHPGVGNPSGTLANAVLYHLKQSSLPSLSVDFQDRPGIVHRIDKDTSGLMVIAKTEYAMSHLAKQFFHHTLERNYLAIIWGVPDPPDGTINGPIGRDPYDRKRMAILPESAGGKHAVTHYQVLEELYYVSLVKCRLETGRTHQIRVHLSKLGHPLFSDAKYGGDRIVKGTVFTKYKQFVENQFVICPRQALHATNLGFVHPGSGKELFFEAPLPEDMESMLLRWRAYFNSRKEIEK